MTTDTDTIDFRLLRSLRKNCEPACAAGLMKEFRRATRFVFMDDPDADPAHGSGNMQEKLDHFLTLCYAKFSGSNLLRILLDVGDILKTSGDLRRAEEIYSEALASGATCNDQELMAESHIRRGETYARQGRWKESSGDLSKSKQLFRRLRKKTDVARVENILGTTFVEQGMMKQAQTTLKRALKVFSDASDKKMEGSVLMNIGIVQDMIGNFDTAVLQYRRASSCFESIGDLSRLAMVYHNMGMTHLHRENLEDARREFERSFRLATEVQDVDLVGLSLLGKAQVSYCLKDYRFALELVNKALSFFGRSGDRLSIADAYKVKGMINREIGNLRPAFLFFQTSLRINNEFSNPLNKGETHFEMGVLERMQGRCAEAREHFANAVECFAAIGAGYLEERSGVHLKALGKSMS